MKKGGIGHTCPSINYFALCVHARELAPHGRAKAPPPMWIYPWKENCVVGSTNIQNYSVVRIHRRVADEMKLEGNVAYGHVSTGQEVAGGEGVYDNL